MIEDRALLTMADYYEVTSDALSGTTFSDLA